MTYLDWKTIEVKCVNCGHEDTDKVPTAFEDDKIGLSALEYPVNCVKCSRTRFYAVRKKLKAFISPEEMQFTLRFQVKRRGKKHKW